MEDTVVTLRFTDLGRARRALHELERLDRDRRAHLRGAAHGGSVTRGPARDVYAEMRAAQAG